MFSVRCMGGRAHAGPRFRSVGPFAQSPESGRPRLNPFRSAVSPCSDFGETCSYLHGAPRRL